MKLRTSPVQRKRSFLASGVIALSLLTGAFLVAPQIGVSPSSRTSPPPMTQTREGDPVTRASLFAVNVKPDPSEWAPNSLTTDPDGIRVNVKEY